ncbi:MAG TPA: MBG domain-containing protein [Verrucomicrobiae bacterium]|nr:MBG domain-containing protein [Verrucomicrobiae bacterium]
MRTKNQILAGLLLAMALLSPVLHAQTTETYSFTSNRAIDDGDVSGLVDVRNVSSPLGNISGVKVRLKVTGEFNGDLYGYVQHSTGFTVLLNRVGKTASNLPGYGGSGFDVTFQTGAANGDIHLYQNVTTPADGSPLTGTWEPDGRIMDPATVTDASSRSSALTSFNGLNADGEWKLYLADVESGGTNLLAEWSLEVTGAASPTITWPAPTDIVYGTALSATQLNATAAYNSTTVPGTFVYTPALGTILRAGTAQTLSVTFTPADSTSYLPVTKTVSLNVVKKGLTIAADDGTKLYGAALPSLTASYSGFVNGDTASSLSTAVSLSTTATASSPVGSYATSASGAASSDYTISYVAGTLSVTPAALIITADDKSKVYGAALPSFTASYNGFVNGDSASSLTTPVSLSTTATVSSAVGSYPITGSGAVSPNYTISYVAGSLSVTPAALSIAADDKSKVYGAALPGLTASYSGWVNGDTASSLTTPVSLATTATAASVVGSYPITASGAASANYTISYVAGALSVTPAALTITSDDKTKVYGAALPGLTASYSGFVNGDTASSLTTPVSLTTTALASSPAGSYPISASGAVSANYAISYAAGTLSVTAAPLIITAEDKSKAYGSALPVFTATYTGFVNGDDASSLVTPVSLATTATASSSVGSYPITGSGAANPNYSISYVAGTLTITPAPLTVTAVDKSKLYGAALPPFTATYGGFVNGDTASSLTTPVSLATTATASSPVGTYPITASGAASANYSISYVAGNLTITPAPLSITADDKSKIYGAALPSLTASYSGFVNGDSASALTTAVSLATTAMDSSPAGPYPITASGAAAANYTISYVAGTLSVTPAPLTITADDKSKIHGAPLPAFTASYSGFVNGDTVSSLTSPVSLTSTATASSPVGTYPISATGAASPNYAISYVAGTLTIGQSSSLGIIASSANPALPAANVTFTMTLSAVAPGAGTVDGTVSFRINGSTAGSAALSGGVAAIPISTLSHGSHTVVAEYPGSANFIGTTNTLIPNQVINTPPAALNDVLERYPTQAVKVRLATLLVNDSDADSDPLNISVSPTSANAGTIAVDGLWAYYTAASGFTNADWFTYTITDGQGGSAIGTVTIALKSDAAPSDNLTITVLGNGSMKIDGNGIPARAYRLQYTDTLSPANWQDLPSGTVIPDTYGEFDLTDSSAPGIRYYRTISP